LPDGQCRAASPGAATLRSLRQIAAKTRLIGVFVGLGSAGDDVGAGQPAVQIDVAAAVGTERFCRLGRGPAADRASLCGRLARAGGRAGLFWCLSWHSTSRTAPENPRRRAARSTRRAGDLRYWCRSRPS